MMRTRGFLVLALTTVACTAELDEGASEDDVARHEDELKGTNALVSNALVSNALVSNALVSNALVSNALISNALVSNGDFRSALTDKKAQIFMRYAMECALPQGDSVTFTNAWGQVLVFPGAIGLAPQWKTGSCDESCQRWVTACLLARTNAKGQRVVISMRKPADLNNNGYTGALNAISLQEQGDFPRREGAFYGNLWKNELFACQGDSATADQLFNRFCAGTATWLCPVKIVGSCVNGTSTDPYRANWACHVSPDDTINGAFKKCTNGETDPGRIDAHYSIWWTKQYDEVITVYRGWDPAHADYVTGAKLQAGSSVCAYKVAREIVTAWGAIGDAYCATTAWDSICVAEAKQHCGDHSVCVTGAPLHRGDSSCIDRVCYDAGGPMDSYCCTTWWDSICVNEAKIYCGLTCP